MEYLNWALENWDQIVKWALQILGLATIIVNITPTETDNRWLGYVRIAGKLVVKLVPNIKKVMVDKKEPVDTTPIKVPSKSKKKK